MLNYACSVVPPGRTFLRRLINLTIGLKMPHHHRNFNLEAKADLKAWQVFLENLLPITHCSFHLLPAFIYGTKWFSEEFPQNWPYFSS